MTAKDAPVYDSDLFAGFAGVELTCEDFQFGHGISIQTTYAHVMAPYLAAFSPAKPGSPHPPPWKSVGGGLSFDITAQLHIPLDPPPVRQWFDSLNTVWWFAALLRLKSTPLLHVPVISSMPFSEVPHTESEPVFWPAEMEEIRLMPSENPSRTIGRDDLEWVKEHWLSGGQLMLENEGFNTAFQAFDQCIWQRSPDLALVSLWGALERLFSPSNQELSFRVSASISAYLTRPGKDRHTLYKHAKKLYSSRSKSAHGHRINLADPLIGTYELLGEVLKHMIEMNAVPSRENVEALLFGIGFENPAQ